MNSTPLFSRMNETRMTNVGGIQYLGIARLKGKPSRPTLELHCYFGQFGLDSAPKPLRLLFGVVGTNQPR